jgi:glycosyltransferase involved in cell wall biosynthesis
MPFAYWLMGEIQPKVFVELGAHSGNSYFSFCQAVREKGLNTRCYAVDTWQGDEQAGFYEGDVFELVNQYNESQYKSFSTLYRMTFDEALAKFQDQSVDLLHIDGLHTYEAVRHDFETWLPKLAPGALVLFHDIKVTHGKFGVWKFWAELKEKYPQNFELRHSHGLGVIELPGSNRAGELVWLREGTAEKKNLLEVMTANGESLMAKARHKELERLASASQTKVNKPEIEKPLNLDLFFAQESEQFFEGRKISEPVRYRENEHSQIRIQLQGKATRAVLWRIDLGDQPGLFRVHELGFTGKNGKKIWRLTDHSDEAVVGGSAERLSGDGFLVCSFGKDPQILLPKLSLSADEKLYEIRIALEALNAKDYLPFLATRYHELESQSRSALAQASEALKGKAKEATNAQSRAENFERIEKNISEHIGELKEELAQQQKSQQEANLFDQTLFKGLIAELKDTREKEAERGQELRQELEAQKVATSKGLKVLGDSLAGLKQELEAQKVETSEGLELLGDSLAGLKQELEAQKVATTNRAKKLGDSLAGLRQELIDEIRELVGKMHERQDHLQQKNLAEIEILRTTSESRMSKNENDLQDVARYAEQIQDSVIAPSSYMIPAPFSWYAYLYKMLKIRKPGLINKTPTANSSPRPGLWRRLERSIRKRRKRWINRIGFDREWYLKEYPDVARAKVDPLDHYIVNGKREGRKKNANDRSNAAGPTTATYADWIRLYDTLTNYERNEMKLEIKQMASPPTFSILMPVYNSKPVWLRRAIESVCHQIYPSWELCIVDDASTDPDVTQVLKEMAAKNPRISIQVRSKNGNISAASNNALSMAQGKWVVFVDHDDELKEDALFWLARAIGTNEKASIIYSDEDKIGEDGVRRDPHFKTEWNPALLLSYNYFCHLLAIRKDLVNQAGGFREGFEGAQDYDLILRCIEHIDPDTILHVPRVLYHWRIHSQSTASNIGVKYGAREAGARAIADHLARKKIAAKVSSVEGGYRVEFAQIQKPKVTILIPTKDQANLLKTCVDSLLSNTSYPNREIMLIDNKTEDSEARALLLSYQAKGIKVLRDEGSFNYSRLNNLASRVAGGDLLLLLNNDIEPMNSDWLDVMVNEISQKDVGAVGAKLFYPDGNIQHGGVIIGLGGVAGHSHKHLSGNFPGYFSRASVTQDLSAVTAACMLIKKEVFVKVGGLDQENLSVAFNDVDLCLKIREQGWRIVWTPFAKLVHHESASRRGDTTPEKQARFASEVAFMKSKWGIKLQQDPHYSPNLTLANEQFDMACPPRLENKWMI